jgi:peptide/nickel transport system permease protein
MLNAIISEQVRGVREGLAQTIRDPTELEAAVAAQKRELEISYGLDQPWYVRLPSTVARVFTLDLGSARTLRGFSGSTRVADIVLERLPFTVILVTSALAISTVIGLFLGVWLSTKPTSRVNRLVSYFSAASNALPTWWLGILLIVVFAFQFRVFPSGGLLSAPPPQGGLARFGDILWHAALPVLTLVGATIGGWTYSVRTMLQNIAQEDFVTVARAKGLPDTVVMRRHIIRVAAAPILTSIILGLAGSFGGAILTETVFNWPGMGRLYYDAVLALDENVIVALTFIYTLIYLAARFILEVLYVVVDPRVRYR